MSFFRIFRANIRNSGFAVHYVARSLFVVVIACLTGLPAAANAADDTFSCLNELYGPLTDIQGTDYEYSPLFNLSNGSRLDARGDMFTGQTDPALPDGSIVGYVIDLRSDLSNSVCWAGGVIHYTNDYDITWGQSKTPNNAALMSWTGDITFDGARIHNAHDAVRPRRSPTGFWTVRNSWVTYNRDDCIENDYMAGGLVDDSLFDGCNVFLSSRIPDAVSYGKTVTVQNSLIRMQEMPGPYGHPDPAIMGHGPLFKYQAASPDLVLRNNIFLMESYVTTKNAIRSEAASFEQLGFRVSQGQLKECSGNVIVWTGPGEFPGDIPADPACVTVTTDRTVWEDARAKWLVEHPLVARIDGVDGTEPAPEPTPAPEPDPDITLEPAPEPDSTVEPAPDTTDETRWFRKDRTGSTFRDGQSPSVDIISPIGGTKVFPSTSLWVEVDVSDNVGVARLEVYINKGPPYIFEGDGTHGFAWVVDNSRNWYVIKALAYDESGNKSVDRIRVFTVR